MSRAERIKQLAGKFIMNRTDEELERRIKKCRNRYVWDIAEIEMARRDAENIYNFFNSQNQSQPKSE